MSRRTVTIDTIMEGRIRSGHPHAAALHLLRAAVADLDRLALRYRHSPSQATRTRSAAQKMRRSYLVLLEAGEPYASDTADASLTPPPTVRAPTSEES